MPSKFLIPMLFFLLHASCLIRDNGVLPEMLILRELGKVVVVAYSIGGTITGLNSGNSIVLQNNGVDTFTFSAKGVYQFPTRLADNAQYSVSVLTQPSKQNCVVANSIGMISSANVTNINIACSAGVLSSGTIINPLTLTGGVTTLNGSPCSANGSGCLSISGYFDSATPDSVLYNAAEGLSTDGTNLYVADKNNNRIRKVVIATGATTTLAGNGVNAKVDGTGTSASISQPRFITTDGTYLYVSDSSNDCIRKININTTVVTTLITDSTLLSDPRGLLVYNNNLYVLNNSSDRLRQIDLATVTMTTVIASGLSSPRNMTIIGSDLYIADSGNDEILKTTIGIWTLTSFAGSSSGYTDGTGSGAQFRDLEGLTTDGTSLYLADTGNHNIRKITVPGAAVTTLAGQNISSASNSGYTNSTTFSTARFTSPKGITSDGLNLYVFDTGNNAIRKIQ